MLYCEVIKQGYKRYIVNNWEYDEKGERKLIVSFDFYPYTKDEVKQKNIEFLRDFLKK